MNGAAQEPPRTDHVIDTAADAQPVFYAFFPLACFISDNNSAEKGDSIAASQEAELTAQFESPGSKVELSGLNFSRWISLQGLCARLSKSDSKKSQIFLDNCSMGKHGAVVIARSFTHVFIRGGNYHAQWLPLMYQNSKINVLSIVNNNIGPDGAAAFAAMLRVNSGLRELNLSSNGLRCDGLQYLASAMFVNDSLRFLCINNNEVCGIDDAGDGEYDASGLTSLVRVLRENTTLRTLKIAENDIKDYGAGVFAEAITANSGLRALDISGNNLFHDLEMSFGQGFALKRNPIIMKNTPSKQVGRVPSPGCSPVAPANPPARRVESPVIFEARPPQVESRSTPAVDEDEGEINPFKTDNLIAQLKSPSEEEAARAETNRVTPVSQRGMGGRKFVNALGMQCKLTHIDLSFNDMGPKGAALLCTSIAECKSVFYLELKGNPIMSDGVIAIADMMRKNKTIQILGLERTGIDARGIVYFADVLSTYQSLKKLNLSLNDIGDEGANKLTVNLKKNSWLRCLYLHRCNLGSDGVAYISSMLQVNHSIRHIGLSCNDIGEPGMMALSATMLLNRSVVSLDISETKLRRRQGKVSEVGTEGWSALASMIRVNSHLNVLNITGYAIPADSLEELLDAMNARRVCLLKADFRDLKWKYDTILQAIDAERSLLAATVKSGYTRLHLCGESGVGKTSALRRWLHLDTTAAPTPLFGSDFFGLGIFSQPIVDIPPTVGIEVHYNSVGSVSVVSWDYGGMKPFQVINHISIGDGASGRFLIFVSSVWGTDKCRSYVHVADEVTSWVRLIMTLGHKESDIAIVFLRGSNFDAAWKGKDPMSCGNSRENSGRDPRRLETSRLGSFEAVRERELYGDDRERTGDSDAWSTLQSMSPQTRELTANEAEDQESPGQTPTNDLRRHRMERQEMELMVEGYDTRPDGKTDSSLDNSESSTIGEMLDVSLTSTTHSIVEKITSNPPDASKGVTLNGALERVNSMSLEQGIVSRTALPANASHQERVSSGEEDSDDNDDSEDRAPSEEVLSRHVDSSNSTKSVRERRRYFEEAVQERIASVLKWNRVPTLFTWDDGNRSGIPQLLPEWLGVKKSTEEKECRVPKLCDILLNTSIHDLKAAGEKIVSFEELLAQARHQIRSLMPSDLRISLNWLHRTGYVYVIDGESEQYVSSESAEEAELEHAGAVESFPTEAAFPLESYPDNEKNIPSRVIAKSPLRSLGKFPLLKTKIILDISWFFGSVLGSILSPRDILPPTIQHQLPWGDKDYLLSLRQLSALCESTMGPIQQKINTAQLICIIENMMLGAWCSSNYLFIPARLSGDKLRWLKQREISRMPLSQFGIGSGLPPVSAVLGRRVDVRVPYLLPSGMFHVLQCLLLQQYERSEWTGMSVTCWESGIGIVANVPSRTKSKVAPGAPTTVCAIIEQIPAPKGVGGGVAAVDGMNNAGVQSSGITDVIAWGDGADCPLAAVQVLLKRCLRALEQAVLVVLAWPPKPEKYSSEAAESGDMDDMKPVTLFKTGGLSEDEEKFLARVLKIEFLRPGCILHTLALTPEHRDCAVYEDESIAAVGIGSPFATGRGNDQLPIFVCCDHLQPRLCKHHLLNGYVLADTPGGGRAILRSVYGALERTLGLSGTGGDHMHMSSKGSLSQGCTMPLPADWNNETEGATAPAALPDQEACKDDTVTDPGVPEASAPESDNQHEKICGNIDEADDDNGSMHRPNGSPCSELKNAVDKESDSDTAKSASGTAIETVVAAATE